MITECNAEARDSQERRGNDEVKPINTEVPEIQRHCGQRQNKGADQEGAGDPIDPVGRNSENQGKGKVVSSVTVQLARGKITEAGDREPRLLSSKCERRRNAHS